tara:strand:+ start:33115 stop:33396 length:282 start_codon:yes stop_codon:yes gene_type:complete
MNTKAATLANLVDKEVLSEFANSLVMFEDGFSKYRRPNAKSVDYKPTHFNLDRSLTETGLEHTKYLIRESRIVGDLFTTYIQGRDEIKEKLNL